MGKEMHPTPMLDQLEDGPWPSFITGIKRLAKKNDMMVDLLGQLEHSYETRKGYWKGGTVGVIGYGGGVIPRFSEIASAFPESKEFHTIRIQPPAGMHYDSAVMRKLCDVWDEFGSGLIAFHGQSGDIMFQGITSDNVQPAFDVINEMGFDMGGAGPAVRTGMSCVGSARCEQSCCDEQEILRSLVNNFLDDMHRPALPYKMKFKVSGCPNDCMNAIERADFAVIGTWRDDIKVDQDAIKAFIADKGRDYVANNVISRCPTNAIALNEDDTVTIENRNCVRCMHCINVMTKGLSVGDDTGITILIGGKRTLKIGDLMGTVVVPFMKVDTEEGIEKVVELAEEVIDFFAENALEHERTGEMIERIGLVNFLEGVGVDVDPNMVAEPRQSSYFRGDGWDEAAKEWYANKAERAS
ncbi:MAG: dissimilatory-type sulfite reductase subunit alpha [Methylococcales bacterium]|nr:dissimilatory-type sulfite reductase subunit alpha [Methylococcales bacterium]MBT7444108.1 dissimilatory-type sulfite reductase subunit alpha [Methylococcales bacterium]